VTLVNILSHVLLAVTREFHVPLGHKTLGVVVDAVDEGLDNLVVQSAQFVVVVASDADVVLATVAGDEIRLVGGFTTTPTDAVALVANVAVFVNALIDAPLFPLIRANHLDCLLGGQVTPSAIMSLNLSITVVHHTTP